MSIIQKLNNEQKTILNILTNKILNKNKLFIPKKYASSSNILNYSFIILKQITLNKIHTIII